MCITSLKNVSGFSKVFLGILTCLFCGGPVLIIVGIVMILSPNDRQDRVNEFNNAVAQFSPLPIAQWNGIIGGYATAHATSTVSVAGNIDGVNTNASSDYVFSDVPSSSAQPVWYNISTIQPFSRTFPLTSTVSVSMSCTLSRCSSSCTSSSNYFCSNGNMASACTATYGGTWNAAGSCYKSSGSCGTCAYTVYLSTSCVVLDPVSVSNVTTNWTESSAKKSCFYPFLASSQLYRTSAPVNVTAQVMSSGDPFVVLQRLTSGTTDFGLTRALQTAIGIGLLAGGCVLTVLLFIAALCACRASICSSATCCNASSDVDGATVEVATKIEKNYNNNNGISSSATDHATYFATPISTSNGSPHMLDPTIGGVPPFISSQSSWQPQGQQGFFNPREMKALPRESQRAPRAVLR